MRFSFFFKTIFKEFVEICKQFIENKKFNIMMKKEIIFSNFDLLTSFF